MSSGGSHSAESLSLEVQDATSSSPQSSISEFSRSSRRDNSAHRAARDVEGLQDYQLGDCLGKGAFGSVYKALNWGTGETVAIKQVKLADMPKADLKVIMLEIDLLKNLKHPNIVKYLGFVKSVDSLYLILEYCENGSLHSICKNFGKFPENLVALYIAQALNGLVYLHEQGVIHRDIKGANILTTKEGLVKLADFGVATTAAGLHESRVVGTPYWMAPEVIELSGATTASDIWSLGCTVIELLDGKPPYHKLQPMPALFRIVNDDHPPLPEGASPAVCDFLLQCFQKDPNLRVSAKKLLKHHWITSARRSDHVPRTLPTQFDEAVESVQQWNKALKSQTKEPLSRPERSLAASPTPQKRSDAIVPLTLADSRAAAAAFRSPDGVDDNWDDDFAPELDSASLLQPLIKPQDNFGGLLSFERLKAFSNAQRHITGLDGELDDELTLSSRRRDGQSDPLRTIRPFKSPQRGDHIRFEAPSRTPEAVYSPGSEFRSPQLQPVSDQTPIPFSISHSLSQTFQESADEDYSDLVAVNDDSFAQKLQGLQRMNAAPDLFEISEFTNSQRHPSRPVSLASSTHLYHKSQAEDRPQLSRTSSAVEILQYVEQDDDESFDDMFEQAVKRGGSDSDSGALLLNNKLSSSWIADDDEDDDPFAELEEGFAGIDLAANIARDRHARLINQVQELVSSLKNTQSDEVLTDLSEQLLTIIVDVPDVKRTIISAHGMLPILEILETCACQDVIYRLLRIVNAIILDEREIQENLCFVGGIPIVTKYAMKRYRSDIRLEAALFVQQMYQTSTLTLQMFVGCGGLNVLVEFLEEDYEPDNDLALIGVNGVWSVFELQGPTPKNDFCRIFSRNCVLYPLSLVLNRLLEGRGEGSEVFESRIANIFFIFSQAENHVKEMIADRMVLKRVLKDLKLMSPGPQITMLKFIKNLSMLSTTLDALQNSNAIEVLSELLYSSIKESHFTELSNQILNTMFNLCRLSKVRQEEAALNGIIPLLMRIAKTDRPLKEFALPILCDMAHSGKIGRKLLWQNKGLYFYISLLVDPNWQVTALDAIFIWLQEETAKVEEYLLAGRFPEAVVKCFTTSKATAFENLLDPLQKLITLSPHISRQLARADFFARIQQKLKHNKAVIRLNLLRVIRSICDSSDERTALIKKHGLLPLIQRLAESDPAVLVRNMASDLMKFGLNSDPSRLNRRRSFLRRSSATPSLASSTSSSMMPPASPTAGRSRLVSSRSSYLHTNGATPAVHTPSRPTPDRHEYLLGTQSSRAHQQPRSSSSASVSSRDSVRRPQPETSSADSVRKPRHLQVAPRSDSSSAPATKASTPSSTTAGSPLKQRLNAQRVSPVVSRLYGNTSASSRRSRQVDDTKSNTSTPSPSTATSRQSIRTSRMSTAISSSTHSPSTSTTNSAINPKEARLSTTISKARRQTTTSSATDDTRNTTITR